MRRFKGRKGTLTDFLYIIPIMFLLAIVILLSSLLLTEFEEEVDTMDINEDLIAQGRAGLNIFNYGFLFLLLGLVATVFITAFYIDTHPAIFIFSLLLLTIIIVVGAIFSNVFEEIILSSKIIPEANKFGIMVYVMRRMPEILGISGFVTLIVMYGKYQRRGTA